MQVSLRQLLVICLVVSLSIGTAVNTFRNLRLRSQLDQLRYTNRKLEADVQRTRESARFSERVLNGPQRVRDSAATILVPGSRASGAIK